MPAFTVWKCGEDEERALTVHVPDAEEAACAWADAVDCANADYDIVAGRSAPDIYVRDAAGNKTKWQVSGKAIPHYYARSRPVK